MSHSEMFLAARAKVEREEREAEEQRAKYAAERKLFLQRLLGGPDMLSWLAPCDDVRAEVVLAEHFQQIRNVVRYAFERALNDASSTKVNLAAAAIADRLIRTNIAIVSALSAAEKLKTVRGGGAKKEPQD